MKKHQLALPATEPPRTSPTCRNTHDWRVVINIGGQKFETWASTLKRVPGSRLARIAEMGQKHKNYDPNRKEFFFDRNPLAFNAVLYYYRTGEMHVDNQICGNIMKREIYYWMLPEQEMEPCCWGHYSSSVYHKDTLESLDDNFYSFEDDYEQWAKDKSRSERMRMRVWKNIEEPSFSRFAKFVAVISTLFVAISIANFVASTYPVMREPMNLDADKAINITKCEHERNQDCIEEYFRSYNETLPKKFVEYIDYTCTGYFTLELLVRFIFCPEKCKFVKDFLNIIDFIVVVPMYISIILRNIDPSLRQTAEVFKVVMMLRIIRVLRIFKLMKHYSAFRVLVYTVKVSIKELFLMIIFLMVGVLLFACVIHFAETITFPNIPIAVWWALVTMTTVGYGDYVPVTALGFCVGIFCVICGVLTIAFTVPIVVNNFTLYYSHAQSRLKMPPRRRGLDKMYVGPSEDGGICEGMEQIAKRGDPVFRRMVRTTKIATVQETVVEDADGDIQYSNQTQTTHRRQVANPVMQ